MDLMARLFRNPWTLLAFSTTVAIGTLIAIVGFGAPPKVLVPVTYATAATAAFATNWARRHLGEL